MKENNPEEKKILIVDENSETLSFLKEEARKTGKNFLFENTDKFTQAVDSIVSGNYDLVILDFPSIRGPYLLNLAFLRAIPVVLLVSSPIFPLEAQYLIEKGIKGILPKENLPEIITILEAIFSSKQSPASLADWKETFLVP
jgi:CheY-like chemotaxis protein